MSATDTYGGTDYSKLTSDISKGLSDIPMKGNTDTLGGSSMGSAGIAAASSLTGSVIGGIASGRQQERLNEFQSKVDREMQEQEQLNEGAINKIKGDEIKYQRQMNELISDKYKLVRSHKNFLDKFNEAYAKMSRGQQNAANIAKQASANQQYRDMLRQNGGL